MLDDYHFLREPAVEVTAAILGIGIGQWVTQKADKNLTSLRAKERATAKMQKHRFDLLPIIDSDGKVRRYYGTSQWNDFETVDLHTLSYGDVIPLQTHVREVIQRLADDRLFYFLSNEERICGLLTIADLNSRAAKIYLFGLTSELEIQFSKLIQSSLSDDELLNRTLALGDSRRFERTKLDYRKLREQGLEGHFARHLYFSDLIQIIAQDKLFNHLKCVDEKQFRDRFREVKNLRNKVAHPNASIIEKREDVANLWQTLQIVEEALFQMRH